MPLAKRLWITLLLLLSAVSGAQSPAYLKELPSVQKLRAELKGKDDMETAAMVMGACWQFQKIVERLAGSRLYHNQLTADEKRMIGEYSDGYTEAMKPFDPKTNPKVDRPSWWKLHSFYEVDEPFLDGLLKKNCSPEFRLAYWRLVGKTPPDQRPAGRPAETQKPASSSESGLVKSLVKQGSDAIDAKDYEKAISLLKQAIESDAKNAEARSLLGQAYFSTKRYEDAVGEFTASAQLDPKQPDTWNWLGTSQIMAVKDEDALTSFTTALELKPKGAVLANAYWGVANASNNLKKYREAEAAAREAVRAEPENPSNHLQLGRALYGLGRYEDGLVVFERARQFGLERKQTLEFFGIGFHGLKDFKQEIAVWKELIQADPKYPSAYYNLGHAYEGAEEWDHAKAAFAQAARIDPKHANAHFELGYCCYMTDENARAVREMKEAIRLNPKHVEARYWLGMTYLEMGDKPGAIQMHSELLTFDPARAKELLAEIKKSARVQ